MFIGRESEIKALNKKYSSNKFEFVVMYGRRRVGKTRLLTEFCKDKPSLFFVAEEHSDHYALKKFSDLILKDSKTSNYMDSFPEWEKALRFLADHYNGKRQVLVIDEFPYIAQANKSIPSLFQNLIDHVFKETDLFIIICGSQVSFMEKEILSYKSPLYGRRTMQLFIKPLDFFTSRKFFENYDIENQIVAYSILGGVPHYLLEFDDNKSIKENIIDSLINKHAYLYTEPYDLLKQELREIKFYNTLIETIASGATKLNEIATKANESTAKVSRYLSVLEDLYIIKKETPLSNNSSQRKSIYMIDDALFRFWYRFVFLNKGLIEQELEEEMYHDHIESHLSTYVGTGFEEVCKDYLLKLNKEKSLPFIFSQIGKWWGKNPIKKCEEEIDIIAKSSNKVIVAECKWTNTLVGVSVYNKLVDRSKLIGVFDEYVYYIFSRSGFTEDLIRLASNEPSLRLIDLKTMSE
ncbi:ATP-binding protein [Acidaminobacter sp. JC074]|uniref:ATP-binding protein n=1 Tax=Acidaminobacter sp. JC074 TaxID=2530199 RepID=UPI001F10FF42|nr:ATP-binding protein [Acidaminobacter sp. JC074]MCH4889313.1 ATP-binding protein [Acidaminobacter sp. JC074]